MCKEREREKEKKVKVEEEGGEEGLALSFARKGWSVLQVPSRVGLARVEGGGAFRFDLIAFTPRKRERRDRQICASGTSVSSSVTQSSALPSCFFSLFPPVPPVSLSLINKIFKNK